MAVLDVVDGVAQHPFRLRLGEDLGAHGPVGVGGDDQEGAGQVAAPVTAGDVGELAPPHQVAEPVAHPGGDHHDVGFGFEQGAGLALGLPASAGHHAAAAGQLQGDGIAEGHGTTARRRPVKASFRPCCDRVNLSLSNRHSQPGAT